MQPKTASLPAPESISCPPSADASRLAARGSWFAFFAAASWAALGVESIVRPYQENYRDLVWMIPFALTVVALVYLHAVQPSAMLRVERAGFCAVMVASAVTLLGSVGSLASNRCWQGSVFPETHSSRRSGSWVMALGLRQLARYPAWSA